MRTAAEIIEAIEQLSPDDFKILASWFAERDAAEWDRQLQADSNTARLDAPSREEMRKDINYEK